MSVQNAQRRTQVGDAYSSYCPKWGTARSCCLAIVDFSPTQVLRSPMLGGLRKLYNPSIRKIKR